MDFTYSLGAQAERVRSAVERLSADRWIARLWEHDASLWSADPGIQQSIRDRLDWLTIADVMRPQCASLRAFARELRNDGITRALLLGMGGSSLFSEVCRKTFGVAKDGVDVVILDTTDPTAIRAQQARGPLEQLLVIVSSKSGTTSEVEALSTFFYEAFKAAGLDAGRHGVAITDAATPLEAQAKRWGLRRCFTHGDATGSHVGGRFSALTFFGLVPASLLGLDVGELLARATEMRHRCGPATPAQENAALVLGAVLGALALVGKDKLTILAAPPLAGVGTWLEQLVAESTGKSGKGIVPIDGEPWREASGYASDRVFIELQLAAEPDRTIAAQAQALTAAGHPVISIQWQDRYDLGGEVIRWSIATTLAGSLLGLNPFDQPNVQESKDRTTALLAHYARDRRFPTAEPLPLEEDVRSLEQSLSAWLQQARPDDYVAVLSFLPRTATLDHAVETLRRTLASRLGAATLLGFGPRYLHSTGQLFKGGADNGIFLFLTAEDTQDLPIPGRPYTFGVLKQAQALGDLQAMQERGRRVLRVHLGPDPERAIPRLARALEKVTVTLSPK